jgi:hypothetical protein
MAFRSGTRPAPRRDPSDYDNDVNLLYEIRDRIEGVVSGGARNCPSLMDIDRVLTALRRIEAERSEVER